MAISNSLNSGVNGIKTFSKSLEVIGDNIANVNTTGFKGSRVTNQDSFSQTLRDSSAPGTLPGTNAMQIGSGSSVGSISQQFTQGVLSTTGGSSDVGISGKGFFKVINPATSEFFYTRAGDFKLDNAGNLVTNNGFNVIGFPASATFTAGTTEGNIKLSPYAALTGTPPVAGAPLNAPTPPTGTAPNLIPTSGSLKSFKIEKDGSIYGYYEGANQSVLLGQVLLTGFANPNALQRSGDNLLSNGNLTSGANAGPAGATAASATLPNSNFGDIIQGTLELSNVDLTEQFSDLIVAQRAFQANSRIVTVSDSVLEEVVNLKR
jgi:flagellar hook protein FlgE